MGGLRGACARAGAAHGASQCEASQRSTPQMSYTGLAPGTARSVQLLTRRSWSESSCWWESDSEAPSLLQSLSSPSLCSAWARRAFLGRPGPCVEKRVGVDATQGAAFAGDAQDSGKTCTGGK